MKAKYVKTSWLLLLLLLAGFRPAAAQSFTGRTVLGEAHARRQVREILKNPSASSLRKPLLATKELAIAVAEPLLFHLYGKEQILAEQPYEIYLIDGYWYINGTLPTPSIGHIRVGGTFEIILAASDGRVVHLTHYK